MLILEKEFDSKSRQKGIIEYRIRGNGGAHRYFLEATFVRSGVLEEINNLERSKSYVGDDKVRNLLNYEVIKFSMSSLTILPNNKKWFSLHLSSSYRQS
jgi:hypothetical protein